MSFLFDPQLIGNGVQKNLGKDFVIRPLALDDYEKGFLEALSHLTEIGKTTKEQFVDRFSYLKAHNHEYFTIVIEDLKRRKIAAAGTVFVERKFIRNNGLVGHIEDIVAHKDYRGKNFGLWIIEQLKHLGKNAGCYKSKILNVPFYEKCGFTKKEVEMVWYIPKPKL